MADTFEALSVALLALLPGALYVWAFEGQVGKWGVSLSDRLYRFFGVSALIHVLGAPLTYSLWKEFVRTGRVSEGDLPFWTWFVALGYVFVPFFAGRLVGRATRARRRWARLFTGPDPAPRAWDFLFAERPSAVIRMRMKESGHWMGGLFAEESYAAGYPEKPQDLFLEEAYLVQSDGSFAADPAGGFVELGSGVLVNWEDVEHLEVFLI